MSTPPFNPLFVFTPLPFIPPPAPAPRPYDHLSDVNPNQGPNGTSTLGGPGLFSMGGDVCFEYGIIAHITGNPDADDDPWEHMQDAITMGTCIDLGKQHADMEFCEFLLTFFFEQHLLNLKLTISQTGS